MIRKRYVSANRLEAQMIGKISNQERLQELHVIRDAMLHVKYPQERWDLADSFMLILRDLIGQRTHEGKRNTVFYNAKNSMYDLAENGQIGNKECQKLQAVHQALEEVEKELQKENEPA